MALLAGTGILLSAPTTFSATKKLEKMSFRSKLAKVDYLGAVTLVCNDIVLWVLSPANTGSDHWHVPSPERLRYLNHSLDPHRYLTSVHRSFRLHRASSSYRPCDSSRYVEESRALALVGCAIRYDDGKVAGLLIRTRVCHRCSKPNTSNCWISARPDKHLHGSRKSIDRLAPC